jgi:hypothetical protein
VQQEEARAAVQEQRLQQDLPVEGHACDAVTGDLLEALDALPGGAGNRRFVLLSALRAHTKPPYKLDLLVKTLRVLNRPGRARTVAQRKPAYPVPQMAASRPLTPLTPFCSARQSVAFLPGGRPSQAPGLAPSGALWQASSSTAPSHGRHCHSTLSLTVIACHSLAIYTVIVLSLLSLLSFWISDTLFFRF